MSTNISKNITPSAINVFCHQFNGSFLYTVGCIVSHGVSVYTVIVSVSQPPDIYTLSVVFIISTCQRSLDIDIVSALNSTVSTSTDGTTTERVSCMVSVLLSSGNRSTSLSNFLAALLLLRCSFVVTHPVMRIHSTIIIAFILSLLCRKYQREAKAFQGFFGCFLHPLCHHYQDPCVRHQPEYTLISRG